MISKERVLTAFARAIPDRVPINAIFLPHIVWCWVTQVWGM
ncbi:MAG: hypothetical protein ACI8V2_004503 [Candidatus Latescibacterota bacterium]|jgi:hypothetical protein